VATLDGLDTARTLTQRYDSSPCHDRGPDVVAFDTTQITSPQNYSNPKEGDPCHPLAAESHAPAVAFGIDDVAHCLRSGASRADKPDSTTYVATSAVRRLTPRECERLQGFPDDYTSIPWRKKPADQCPDGPRYKALGNSMAVPVMHWIGKRIDMVEGIINAS
jgi:DNA (cytosine-5)-methyltransferase 1